MADGREAVRRPAQRAPLQGRSRRRWAIAGGVVVCWLGAEIMTGSVAAATVVLVAVVALGVVTVVGLRASGITPDHPWLRRMATRPWRDGRAVLNVAVHHLPEVFIVTPSGSVIAPDIVELQMSPGDLASLREWLELDQVSASVTEAYEDQVAKRGARFAGAYRPEVYIVPDYSLPQGRYRLQRGVPASARPAPEYPDLPEVLDVPDLSFRESPYVSQGRAGIAPDPASAKPTGRTRLDLSLSRTVMDGMPTVMEQIRPAVPKLRLVTGSSVAETSTSGACAGRGPVELELPDVPTVSRVHATFTFTDGHWWVTNKGVNGLLVNGVPVLGKQSLSDGDSIRWGKSTEAPTSTVEIG
jgi:pSer/pThr/pTyr-binding forkhead associated (FHA) protein